MPHHRSAGARVESAEALEGSDQEPEFKAFPNPFTSKITIAFYQPQAGHTRLCLQGRYGTADVLLNRFLKAGLHTVEYNGSQLPPDIYIAQLVTNGKVVVSKILKE